MRLRTLGALRLEGAEFTRPKPLLLVTYLALEGAKDRRHLAELFWPGLHDPLNSLTVALTRLRKGAPGAIEADDSRVWAAVPSDAQQFLHHLQQRELKQALGLYTGPFLEGYYLRDWSVELEEWVYKTREFLGAHARRAWLELAEHEAASGRFDDAARHAERAFDASVETTEPEELARLHTIMLAGNSVKATIARAEAEDLGIQVVGSMEEAKRRLSAALGSSAPLVPHNLPVRSAVFVGRDLELTEVGSLLAKPDCQLITFVGVAGVGKTRLALQVAQDQLALGAFSHGIFFVSLEALSTADSVAAEIADALSVSVQHAEEPIRQVSEHLLGKEMLLILDNFDHLLNKAVLLSELTAASPSLTVLVTSRERLNLEGERIFPVTGLPFPGEGTDLEVAGRYDAVRLFVQWARRVRPDFKLDSQTLPHVLRICGLVEGLPLALELSAVWLKAMSIEDIARELEHNLDLLASPHRHAPERHQSMRAAFEHSWRLLTPDEQACLRKLSCFIGGFRRDGASQVAGASIPILASLVDKSLLRVDRTGRFDRHPLLYQYIRDKLRERPDELRTTQNAHGRYYASFLANWQDKLRRGEQGEALAAIEDELENIRSAWRWAIAERRLDKLRDFVLPLAWFFKVRGRRQEGIDMLGEVVTRDDGGDPAFRAVLGNALTGQARLFQDLGEYEQANRRARRGLALLEQCGDDEGVIAALDTLGRVAWRAGSYSEAKVYWEKGLAVARGQRDTEIAAIVLGDIAMIEQELGKHDHAERNYREALSTSREYGNRLHVVRNLNNLGELYFVMERLEQAQRLWEEGMALAEQIRFQGIVPHLVYNLGLGSFEQGRFEEAEGHLQRALGKARECSDLSLEARAYARLSRLATSLGQLGRSERYARQALQLSWSIQDMPDILASLTSLAELRAEQGRFEEATALTSVIVRSPGVSQFDAGRVQALVQRLSEQLSPTALVEAMEHGKMLELPQLIDGILETQSAA